MSQAEKSYEGEGVEERRAQSKLTERVGVPLIRRSKSTNLKWSTWIWRLGLRKPRAKG